ncbi:GerAB/ArcD/ProY family transporter [Paenibacillus thalictri]|uniref:Spore gernimation protein n=1 Tax=Paenibacillus thalictri TaxID=2527873 RepID=A0A4Q9DSI3_9BACL|nr:endospore germination permease [Paenibacillus thalictri]TBL79844.1 spore gernimation protein [Paenibacillus thalictri]
MRPKERISPSQMALMLCAFMLGSSIVFIPSPAIAAAGNDTWLSLLLSGALGMLGLASVLYLHRLFPDMSFIQYFNIVFGRWVGTVLGAFILLVLVVMIANITVGVGAFFTSTMMVDTPIYVFNTLILIVSALTARAGVEVMARMFSFFLIVMLATIVIILICNMTNYHAGDLLPQFAKGVKPIIHGMIIMYGFPYSELFVFAALLGFVRPLKSEPLGKLMYTAYLVNVATFLAVILCSIMVFGLGAGERKFSLYELARVIELPGFIERVEAVAGITLITGSYIKSTIALLALSTGLSHLLNLKDPRAVIYPLTLLMIFLSLTMFSTEMEAQTFWTLGVSSINIYSIFFLIFGALLAFVRFRKRAADGN